MSGPASHPTLERLGKFALTLPAATEDFPWGIRVAKVAGKIFAFLGSTGKEKVVISVKLPSSSEAARSLPCARPTAYGLGRSNWVTIDVGHRDAPSLDLLTDWIEESYRAVAPAKLIAGLDQTCHDASAMTALARRS